FDYGAIDAWMRHQGSGPWTAIGGDEAITIWSDGSFEVPDRHTLEVEASVRPGERFRLALISADPAEVEGDGSRYPDGPAEVDEHLEQTISSWREWSSRLEVAGPDAEGMKRSAIVLKALTYEPTGAIAAAATTSLPEVRNFEGGRNWDYRYSWI